MAIVNIKIEKTGKTHIEIDGVEGTSCEHLSDLIIAKMGHVETSEFKPEYEETHVLYNEM